MATVVLADDGITFDGRTPGLRPLGGVESAVVALTEALAVRGHDVQVFNNCEQPLDHRGVRWRPLADGLPDAADLYIANRGDNLLTLVPGAGRTVFWTHNPCRYMLKWRYLSKLWRRRPVIVFVGDYHATTLPGWVPDGGRRVIPLGLPDAFCDAEPATAPPPPRAVFTSNPLRGLDWLLEVWATGIYPEVPAAELHLFTGAATYGAVGARKAAEMERVLEKARGLATSGVVLRDAVPKGRLIEEFRKARCMLYRGDENETFCLALGEAQAMGLPCVVTPVGATVERVIDGETGTVAADHDGFALAARRLLTDDDLWRRCQHAALARRRGWRWPDAAAAFEELIP